jgi:tetratricopeptide (TPR) repeat protein
LLKPKNSNTRKIVALFGGGGIGKSTLACRFAKFHQDDFPDGVIGLRVEGKEIDTIAREFVGLCEGKVDSEDERDAATLMQEVFAHRRMLLIFDNAEDASIKKLLPGGNNCAVIVTTRIRELSSSLELKERENIELPWLSENEALELLRDILEDTRVDNALPAAKELVELVGNSPLALQVLGATLKDQHEPLNEYVEALKEEKDELLEELKSDFDRDLNVEASLNLSLKWLSDEEINFFACLSVCAAEGFTQQTAMATAGYTRKLPTKRHLNKLYNLSLLNHVDTTENRFVLHPIVRAYAEALAKKRELLIAAQERHANFFLTWLKSENLEDETVVAKVAANLDDIILAAKWLQANEDDTKQRKIKNYTFALQLHPLFEQYGYWEKVITLVGQFQSWAEQFEDWNALVKYQMHEARYWSFKEEFEKAEEILKSAQGNLDKIEEWETRKRREAKILNVLGSVYQKWGKVEEAIETFRDEVLIEEEIDDTRSLAIVYNRLGKLLQSQGELTDAQQTFEQGIEIAKTLNDLSSLAIGLNCLGGVLQQQRKLEQAQQAFEQRIEIAKTLNDQSSVAIIAFSMLMRYTIA